MKKIILSALSMMVALTMSAITYQDQVSITVDDGTYMNTIVVGEADELPAGINNGYASEIQNLDEMPLAIYALYNGVKYNPFAMKSYENQPLGIKTTGETTYTLYFDDVTGTVNLYDKKLGAAVPVTESGDYEFTITNEEKNSLLNDRFYLNYNAAAFAYSLTTNAYGWASFSIEAEDVVATVPTGLKIYKGALAGDVLSLTEVDYVPMSEGVIVFGEPNTKYYFAAGSGSSDYSGNSLKPSSAWTSNTGNIYVLHDEALYQYTGSDMPANKAYLPLPGGASSAPKHIRMVINGTTAVDNVEAETVKAEKFVEDGQVYIRRGNEVYNLQGQKVNF